MKNMRLHTICRPGIFTSLLILALNGCAVVKDPEPPKEAVVRFPDSLPTTTITNFSPALACMDDMMVAHHRLPIYLTSAPISNMTNEHSISKGATEMLISAVSKMAIRSGAVRYVTFEPAIQNVLSLQGAHPQNSEFRAPDYFIRGGLTQVNKSFWSGQNGVGGSVEIEPGKILDLGTFFQVDGQEDITASTSRNSAYGTLSMDLNAGHVASLQIIPGATSSNTLAMKTSGGSAMTGDLSVMDLGISFTLTDSYTEDMNTVLRALIEVGVIELVGKLQGLPYGRCLMQAGINEERDVQLLRRYILESELAPSRIVAAAQQALHDMDYYRGDVNGKMDESLEDALRQYQMRMGLLSTGVIGFDTFRALNSYTPVRDTPYVTWWLSNVSAPAGSSTVPTGIGLEDSAAEAKVEPTASASERPSSADTTAEEGVGHATGSGETHVSADAQSTRS